MRAAPAQRQQQRDGGRAHQQRAEHIELVRMVMGRQAAQGAVAHHAGADAERHVDPEDQRPVQMLGEEPAEDRAGDGGGDEHHREIALVAAALARSHQQTDDGLGERDQATAADTLHRAGNDQPDHARRQRAGDRADEEQADGDQQHRPRAVDIGELADQRRHRGAGQQIGGDDPGKAFEVAELRADGGQRRRDDGLVKRAEEHCEHDADDDRTDLGVIERCCHVVRRTGVHRVTFSRTDVSPAPREAAKSAPKVVKAIRRTHRRYASDAGGRRGARMPLASYMPSPGS